MEEFNLLDPNAFAKLEIFHKDETKYIDYYFFAVAPGSIRPFSKYHVAFGLQSENEDPVSFKIIIDGDAYLDSKVIEIMPNTTQLINFQVPNIRKGSYRIAVQGVSDPRLMIDSKIEHQGHKFYALFQTDKSIYKPGDVVRYRILFLDPYLKPFPVELPIDICILDSEKNRVKVDKNIKLNNNIYNGSINLAETAVLGMWTIFLEAEDDFYQRTFEVAEYILPKFQIYIDAPKFVLCKSEKFQVTIKAKYNFGKPVQGTALVKIRDIFKSAQINGKTTIKFDIKKDLKFGQAKDETLTLQAQVQESSSGEIQNVTTKVKLCKREHNLEIIHVPRNFFCGIPFEVIIKVNKYDGTPLTQKASVFIYFETQDNPDNKIQFMECLLDDHGVLKATITIEDDNKSYVLKAKYLDNEFEVGILWNGKYAITLKVEDPETVDPFIKGIVVGETRPSVNEELTIEIRSNQNFKYFFYQVSARNDIVLSECIEFPESKIYNLKIKITQLMVPKAGVFIYTVFDEKLIYDELTIQPIKELPSNIHIDAPQKVHPGSNISISVQSNPNSYVGILGIDKSATLLSNVNEISLTKIVSDLERYYSSSPGWYYGFPGFKTGMIILTNADTINENAILMRRMQVLSEATMPRSSILCDPFVEKLKQNIADKKEIPEIIVRKKFPEVWIWSDTAGDQNLLGLRKFGSNSFEIFRNSGQFDIDLKVPDNMTTWVLSGFSLDAITGLNITEMPRELEVFQNFFVSTNLPYSVRQGEIFELPIILYNYLQEKLKAEITLDNQKQEFDFISKDNPKNCNLSQKKTVAVDPNTPKSTSFLIRPKFPGTITIYVTAKTPIYTDVVEQTLLIEPDGVTNYVNKAILVDLRDKSEEDNEILIEIPENAVPGSIQIGVSAIGDVLGPALTNLEDLIRMPCGCGEQNIAKFVPSYLVLNYMQAIGNVCQEIEEKALNFLVVGYQRQLTFKHPDGSYSAFGPQGRLKPNTWLTAYAIRSFRQAAKFIYIDENVIKEGLQFLAKIQTAKGNFTEFGWSENLPIDSEPRKIALTAITILAFLENSKEYPEYQEIIDKGLDYLAQYASESDNTNLIAISAYVLQLGNHPGRSELMDILRDQVYEKDGLRWWSQTPLPNQVTSQSIEMNAFALLAFLEDLSTDIDFIIPIVKWIISQRNDRGGFQSSYDTVVGLQALTKAAERLYTTETEMELSFSYIESETRVILLNKDNLNVLHMDEPLSSTRQVYIYAEGYGRALVQVSYKYNLNVNVFEPKFIINPEIILNPDLENIKLIFSVQFIPDDDCLASKMSIMEVNLPTGYIFNSSSLKCLQSITCVQKVEIQNMDSLVIIYFDSLESEEVMVGFDAIKIHNVDEQKPTPVVIYDYYNKNSQARAFYSLPESIGKRILRKFSFTMK